MKRMVTVTVAVASTVASLATGLSACGESSSAGDAPSNVAPTTGPSPFSVAVPEAGRVFVRLEPTSVVAVDGDGRSSNEWDLAFEGYDVFTNGGASGAGQGGALGPFGDGSVPVSEAALAPFVEKDKIGGPFVDWYFYEQGPAHLLWSRYHVYGVRDGARMWKVQILSYYGKRDGAAVPGLYSLRYAEVTPDSVGPSTLVEALDGTGGAEPASASAKGECLNLATGERQRLSVEEAAASRTWHLCVRRTAVQVNGELGGPGAVGAVDFEGAQTRAETADVLKARTPDSERGRFDAVTAGAFEGRTFRGDRIVSPLGDKWIAGSQAPFTPAPGQWLVADARGARRYLVQFDSFTGASARTPGTIMLTVTPVKK